ncbi:hypothetical protein ACROYT_G032211 [Oculina patagonica]
MGCTPSTPCLSRTKIKPEQEPFPHKQEGEKNEEQSSRDSLQKSHSKDEKDRMHEVEPPSQPLNAWPQLSERENHTQPEHELVHQNPSRAPTRRSSELQNQLQSDQLHEQVLPNQPQSELEDQNQPEQTEKGSQRQPHEWKSKEQVGQNLPEEVHKRGPTAQPYACQPSASETQNQTEHVHKEVRHTNESAALEKQKQLVHVNEQDSPVQPQTQTSNELEKNSKPEQIPEKESVFQSHKGQSSEQENEGRTEQALEKLPIKQLENQSEKVHEQKLLTRQQHAFQSVEQVNPNQTEQALRELSPNLNPSETLLQSESESQLEHVNEQKPLTQPSTYQSGEQEKQNEPQQTPEHGTVTQPNTLQSRDGLELQSESEPEQANQTESPRQEGISIPEHWAPMPRPDTKVHMLTLLPSSQEYQMVVNQ